MPAARGVKRTASKASSSTSAGPKNKKKRAGVQLEVPVAPKKRGRVVACGQGDVGQLGLGEDVVETTRFKFISALGDNIVDICAGGMHSVALDHHGKVWTFGCNDEGALGRTTATDTEEGTPGVVALPAPAVTIAAGDSHTAALLEGGDVYAWGAFRDSHGSMGLVVQGRGGKACREPVRVAITEPAAAIASGGDHLVVLTVSGTVYTMGCGEQGQLGRLPQRSASREARNGFNALLVPSKVSIRGGATKVWAGYHATFALDSTGEKMMAWGLNNYGQLGITGEKRKSALYQPLECDAFSAIEGEGWAQVACGQHHSLALDADGRCYSVGRCEYGRLGLGDRAGDAEGLEPIPALQGKHCISIAAGTSSSFAVTDNGEAYAWGMGSEGQLGTGGTEDATAPARLALPPPPPPRRVAAGGQHALLLLGSTADPEVTSKPAEAEVVEQKSDEREKEPKRRPNKRQKVQEDTEMTSSKDAEPTDVEPAAVSEQTLNGSKEKPTPMDVDDTDTDKAEHVKDDTKPDTTKTDAKQENPPSTEDQPPMDTDSTDTKEDNKPNTEQKAKEESVTTEKTENKTQSKDENIVVDKKTETKVVDKKTETKVVDKKTETKVVDKKTETKVVDKKPETKVVDKKPETKVVDKKTETKVVDKKTETKVVEKKAETNDVEMKDVKPEAEVVNGAPEAAELAAVEKVKSATELSVRTESTEPATA